MEELATSAERLRLRRAETMESMRFAWFRKPKRKWNRKRFRRNESDEDKGDCDSEDGQIERRGAQNCSSRRHWSRRSLNVVPIENVIVRSKVKVPFLSTSRSNITTATRTERNSNSNFSTKWTTTSTRPMSSLLLMLIALIYVVAYVPTELASGLLLLRSSCLTSVPNCACLWKNGKFVAECVNAKLSEVPNNDYYDFLMSSASDSQSSTLNRDIQHLDLAENNITHLGDDEFYAKKFRNLQKIHLSSNQISRIEPSAFRKLTGLIELDLSSNSIAELLQRTDELNLGSVGQEPNQRVGDSSINEAQMISNTRSSNDKSQLASNQSSDTKLVKSVLPTFLYELTRLRQLNLASNQLQRLDAFTFIRMAQLRQLFLSNNQISYVDEFAFVGLETLNVLHLNGNKLTSLSWLALARLPQVHALKLAQQSGLACDCSLRPLARHLRSAGAAAGRLQDEPLCAGGAAPSRWTNMTPDEFECAPKFAAQTVAPTSLAPDAAPAHGRVELAPLRYATPGEPLGLSAAFGVADELDLDLTQVEWALVERPERRRTLWSSDRGVNGTSGGGVRLAAKGLAVADYVTRVNSTAPNWPQAGGGARAPSFDLIRVTHLIIGPKVLAELVADASPTSGGGNDTSDASLLFEFVCIARNRLDAMRVVQSVSIDSGAVIAMRRSDKNTIQSGDRKGSRAQIGQLKRRLEHLRATLAQTAPMRASASSADSDEIFVVGGRKAAATATQLTTMAATPTTAPATTAPATADSAGAAAARMRQVAREAVKSAIRLRAQMELARELTRRSLWPMANHTNHTYGLAAAAAAAADVARPQVAAAATFVPLYVHPIELLDLFRGTHAGRPLTPPAAESDAAARPLSDAPRTTLTRQTNASAAAVASAKVAQVSAHLADEVEADGDGDEETRAHKLVQVAAAELIVRYTSNRRALMHLRDAPVRAFDADEQTGSGGGGGGGTGDERSGDDGDDEEAAAAAADDYLGAGPSSAPIRQRASGSDATAAAAESPSGTGEARATASLLQVLGNNELGVGVRLRLAWRQLNAFARRHLSRLFGGASAATTSATSATSHWSSNQSGGELAMLLIGLMSGCLLTTLIILLRLQRCAGNATPAAANQWRRRRRRVAGKTIYGSASGGDGDGDCNGANNNNNDDDDDDDDQPHVMDAMPERVARRASRSDASATQPLGAARESADELESDSFRANNDNNMREQRKRAPGSGRCSSSQAESGASSGGRYNDYCIMRTTATPALPFAGQKAAAAAAAANGEQQIGRPIGEPLAPAHADYVRFDDGEDALADDELDTDLVESPPSGGAGGNGGGVARKLLRRSFTIGASLQHQTNKAHVSSDCFGTLRLPATAAASAAAASAKQQAPPSHLDTSSSPSTTTTKAPSSASSSAAASALTTQGAPTTKAPCPSRLGALVRAAAAPQDPAQLSSRCTDVLVEPLMRLDSYLSSPPTTTPSWSSANEAPLLLHSQQCATTRQRRHQHNELSNDPLASADRTGFRRRPKRVSGSASSLALQSGAANPLACIYNPSASDWFESAAAAATIIGPAPQVAAPPVSQLDAGALVADGYFLEPLGEAAPGARCQLMFGPPPLPTAAAAAAAAATTTTLASAAQQPTQANNSSSSVTSPILTSTASSNASCNNRTGRRKSSAMRQTIARPSSSVTFAPGATCLVHVDERHQQQLDDALELLRESAGACNLNGAAQSAVLDRSRNLFESTSPNHRL